MSEQEQREVPAHVKKALDEWVAHYRELLAFKDMAQVRIAHLERQLAEADAARRHAQEVSSDLVMEKRELEFMNRHLDDMVRLFEGKYEKEFGAVVAERDEMFRRIWPGLELIRRLKLAIPTSKANVDEHVRLQALHKEADEFLAELPANQKSETIASVTAWANETFGKATVFVQIQRAKQEFDELVAVLMGMSDDRKLAEEAADVVICLYRVIGTLDPEAINKKMKKNRARKWQVDGQGCAQHVEED